MADRYRRKPTEITAAQWDGSDRAREAIYAMGAEFTNSPGKAALLAGPNGQSGWVSVPLGTWVATDGTGDFWPIAHRQFAATYEPVRPDGTVDADHAIGLDGRCDACDPAPEPDTEYGDPLARELHATTDAQVWARRFMETVHNADILDDGAVLAWMANAIETGRDHGRAGYEVLRSEVDQATSDLAAARSAAAELVNLTRALDGLLAAYRTGTANHAGKHIDAARTARAKLAELGVTL